MVRQHCLRVEANLLQKPFGIVNHVEPQNLHTIGSRFFDITVLPLVIRA